MVLALAFFIISPAAEAATSPNLGAASTFSILSGTYTNTVGGSTLNGDLGYTTAPAVAPTVNGNTYVSPNTTYTTAGTDQGAGFGVIGTAARDT